MAVNDPDNVPSPAQSADWRLFRFAIAVLIVGVMCVVGYGFWDVLSRSGIDVGCRSDYLGLLSMHLSEYAAQHDDQLPPADELLSVASGGLNCNFGCNKMQLPYQWDLRLAGKRLGEIDKRALAWCPPGGHGNYVGAIVIEQGKLSARTLSINELRALVGDYQTK